MQYNYDWAISNIHNVVVALNEGGMLGCSDIADKVWADAPEWKKLEKIGKSIDPSRRSVEYARHQIRKEVRRSLYAHFNDPDRHGFDIYRATPCHTDEQFWVSDVQMSPVSVNWVDYLHNSTAAAHVPLVDSLAPIEPDDSSLIARLLAANNSDTRSYVLVQDASLVVDRGNMNFVNMDMPQEFADILTEDLGQSFLGVEDNSENRQAVSNRIASIINQLESAHE